MTVKHKSLVVVAKAGTNAREKKKKYVPCFFLYGETAEYGVFAS